MDEFETSNSEMQIPSLVDECKTRFFVLITVQWSCTIMRPLQLVTLTLFGISYIAYCERVNTTIGDILQNLISDLEDYLRQDLEVECSFYKWIQQQINEHNSNTTNNKQFCESSKNILKSFTSNSLYSLYFKDMCSEIWVYDERNIYNSATQNIKHLKTLVNTFISADDQHWRMYINDWKCLDLDETDKKYSDLLSYLFSDYTLSSRKTVYETIKIDAKINGDIIPQNRYIIISLLEYLSSKYFANFGQFVNIYLDSCTSQNKCGLQYVSYAHCEAEDNNHIQINDVFDTIIVNDANDIELLYKYGTEYFKLMIELMNSFCYHHVNNYRHVQLWQK